MKKILSVLWLITLIGTSTTSLFACDNKTKIHEYSKKELGKLKKENKINTDNKEIRDNLEWMAPQEKPFKKVDNKYYFVVWRGNKNNNWRCIKFQISTSTINPFIIDSDGVCNLEIANLLGDLYIIIGIKQYVTNWFNDSGTYFKVIYRWNLLYKPEFNLIVNNDGNVKVNK